MRPSVAGAPRSASVTPEACSTLPSPLPFFPKLFMVLAWLRLLRPLCLSESQTQRQLTQMGVPTVGGGSMGQRTWGQAAAGASGELPPLGNLPFSDGHLEAPPELTLGDRDMASLYSHSASTSSSE